MRVIRNLHVGALVCLAILFFAFGPSASAQTFRGTILGTVTDSSGASVVGATVTIKNTGTGLTRTVTTAEDGSYSVPELPIGNYNVTVTLTGFKSGVVNALAVEVSTLVRADVALQAGDIAQQIEVQGDTLPQVDTTEDTLGGIIQSRVVTNLPVNGRDYTKLIFLVPGVTGSPDQITDSPGSYGVLSVNGARGRSNNFLLDGTDMNDGYRNDPAINEAGVFGTPATILPLEAIAELRVLSNFEAEYGRSAGAVINIVTKSGTDNFHGSAFDFFRNTDLNARNYFNTVQNSVVGGTNPQDPFHDNQFGAAVGGPIIKDKTFFYVDYEGVRETGSESSLACVPTATDIALATPAGGVNPVIASLISAGKAWPAPNLSGSCIGGGGQTVVADNASLATPFSNSVDNGIVKIDQQLNANNLLTGRYYIGNSVQLFPLALTGGGLLPNYDTETPTRVQMVALSYVTTISPALTLEFRLGWNRFAEGFFPQDRSFNPTTIGLDNVSESGTGTLDPYNFGLPTITVSPFAQLGADKGDPRQRGDTNRHMVQNVSWKRGKHDIKFGYEFRRTSVSQIFNRTARGTLDFASLNDFLAGNPDDGSQIAGNTNRNTFENSYAGYFQDSYRVKRNFTLNLGLRYDYFGIVQDKQDNFTNIDPTTGTLILVGQGRLYQPDFRNWAPRVSVAWDVMGTGKTVVRAGYGIFYDAYSQDLFEGHLPFNSSFDPGPEYNGFGPNPISFAGITGTTLTAGQPIYGATSPMPDAFGVDQNIRTPYLQNFNLNLQQQLTRKMVFQIGYVGSTGHKLLRFRDINQPTLAMIQQTPYGPNSIAEDPTFDPVTNPNVPGCFCTPHPFGTSPFNFVNYEEASANSSYNSLQTSWRINDWHGLTSTVNYTWSHSIDDASDGEDYVPNAAQPDNSQAPLNSNRGNSNFDVRNRFTWNFIYQLPDRKGQWKRLTDGWGVNGIVTVQSGQPFQLNYNFEDDYNGSGEDFARPDVVGPIIYNQNDPSNYLNLTSFAVPCTLTGGGTGAGNCALINPATGAVCPIQVIGPNCINSQHFGSEGRNSLIGPHFRQFDFSIFKDTAITERLKLQLRFEAYNLFNHANFANPYLPNFIADAAPNGFNANGTSAGSLGLTTTGDVGIGYPVLGSGGPRSLQIAAKFVF